MSVSLVGTPTLSSTVASTTLTCTLPSGITTGDYIIVMVGNGEDSPIPTITGGTLTTGYTELGSLGGFDYGAAGIYTHLYYKVAGASETNPTITWNTGTAAQGGLFALTMAYRPSAGWHATAPITLADSGNSEISGVSSTPQTTSITTTYTNTTVLNILQTSDNNTCTLGTANSFSIDGGSNTTDGSDSSMYVASRAVSSPGSVDMPIWSLDLGPDSYAWRTVVLREASSIIPGPTAYWGMNTIRGI